ncbi:hypothetical protein [Paenibacillus oleatilyticus]|uniref:Uncharacterized protein n=1 Tax=Paenibacillus oleatilyticus TaxID=2594886 RepID=A0ABV4UXG2_9BACL
MNEPYVLESMDTGDGAHLLALARNVGWNFSEAQSDLYLCTGPVFGHRDGGKWISLRTARSSSPSAILSSTRPIKAKGWENV